eukprot:130745_1
MAEASGYTEGYWLWDDPDHGGYTKFDDPTSKQIEDKLKEAVDKKTKGPIEVQLSAGPWFGLQKNKGVYSCVLMVDCTDPNSPVIHSARQTNTNSGYKRPIKREPPLDAPLDEDLQNILDEIEGKWEWKDDYGWKEYDLETIAQVEGAFKKKERKVELSKGTFFSKSPNTYYIEFNYLSLPASAQQHNRKSHYGRWVRRIPTKKADQKKNMVDKQTQFMLKNDKHFLCRQFYGPLSKEDYLDQKNDDKLKENLKCSICLSEFEEKELLEEQKGDKAISKKIQCCNDNDDEKSTKHKYDLTKVRGLVNDDTIVGLINCSYGHYFHAGCILPHLSDKKTCPNCTVAYGIVIGHQPEGRLYVTKARARCAGFPE